MSPDVSPLWTPFALSIRASAFEELEDDESARDDYAEALGLYGYLEEALGKKSLARFKSNIQFVKMRLKALPPGTSAGRCSKVLSLTGCVGVSGSTGFRKGTLVISCVARFCSHRLDFIVVDDRAT